MIDPVQNSIVYAGTRNGVYKSTDYGNSWVEMNDGLSCLDITCMDIAPDHYLYCGTDSVGMFRWSLALHVGEHLHRSSPGNDLVYVTPNPTSNHALIRFTFAAATEAKITIYNIQGNLIKSYETKEYAVGSHSISWDGCDTHGKKVACGVYFVKLQTGTRTTTTKLSLITR